MTDNWNKIDPEQPAEPVSVPEQPAEQPAEAVPTPEQPAEQSASEAAPQPEQPSPAPQAPYNGWSSDGSYRYVPPRVEQPRPPVQSPVPPHTPPAYTPGGVYGDHAYHGVPQSPLSPQPPKKKGNGLLVALAIICALAVVASVVFLGIGLMSDGEGASSTPDASNTTSDAVNSDAPSLEITDWDDNDGGLSNKEIVNRNYHATVVITTYIKNGSYNFGESALSEAGGASGIVMSADGYIITNWHCVINEDTGKPYDRVDVTTYDGKT